MAIRRSIRSATSPAISIDYSSRFATASELARRPTTNRSGAIPGGFFLRACRTCLTLELESGYEIRSRGRLAYRPSRRVHPLRHPRKLRDVDPRRLVARRVIIRMQQRAEEDRRNPSARIRQMIAPEIPPLVVRRPIPQCVELEVCHRVVRA